MLTKALPYAHELMRKTLMNGDIAIDGTCGNGHDTLLLSELVGIQGKVFAFDIQEQAILQTKKLLSEFNKTNVTVIHNGHEHVEDYIDSNAKIGGAIFNLGYLPRGDKQIVTKPETTIAAIDKITTQLKSGGVVATVVYHGHEGGEIEKNALLQHLSTYDQKQYSVLQYGFINQKNSPPFLLAIQKK